MSSVKELPVFVEKSIKNIIEKEGYLTYHVHKQALSPSSPNLFGIIHEVDVKGTTKDGDHETNLFVKVINASEDMRWMSINSVYNKELFAYNELSKIFTELQDDANVPLQERYKMVKSYDDSNAQVIILENIARSGYKTYKTKDAPLKFIEMSIIQMAKYHALSFALERKRPEYFEENIKTIKYPFNFNDNWEVFIKSSMIHVALSYVDDELKDKVKNSYRNIASKCSQYFQDKSIQVCLCHGDYKISNIMAKTNEGVVEDVVPVDYQFLHYGCPVFDFLFFIFHSTDRKFRKAHLSRLRDLYHDTLKTFLEYFKIDVELVYPRNKFEEVYKDKLDFGLIVAYIYLPFMLAPEDNVPDMTKLKVRKLQVQDIYKDLLRDIIEDYIEWGYIV